MLVWLWENWDSRVDVVSLALLVQQVTALLSASVPSSVKWG